MKPWIKRALIGIFGASVLFGGLAACSHRGSYSHGWQAMSEEDAAKTKAKIVERSGMIYAEDLLGGIGKALGRANQARQDLVFTDA